jgi:hypothetical protein
VRLSKEGTDRLEEVQLKTREPVKDDSKEGCRGGDHERNPRDWAAIEGIDGQHGSAEARWDIC